MGNRRDTAGHSSIQKALDALPPHAGRAHRSRFRRQGDRARHRAHEPGHCRQGGLDQGMGQAVPRSGIVSRSGLHRRVRFSPARAAQKAADRLWIQRTGRLPGAQGHPFQGLEEQRLMKHCAPLAAQSCKLRKPLPPGFPLPFASE